MRPPASPADDMTDVASFHHSDAGTDEAVWTNAGTSPEGGTVPLDLSTFDRLIVLAAHPDDETLMCGGLIATAAARSLSVDVIVATDGEASHPDSPTHRPRDLARTRVMETTAAVGVLAPQARPRFLHLPDGHARDHVEEMAAAVVETVAAADGACLLVSTWRGDRHPDHHAAACAASVAAWRTDSVHLEAPLWFWHWGSPADLGLLTADGPVLTLDLTPQARSAKRAAVAVHESQVEPLGPEPGNEVLLGRGMLSHVDRATETFVRTPPDSSAPFDHLHHDDADPWGTRTSWYEQRKRDLTVAALPDRRYGTALEVGCSVGTLAGSLAGRCDRVVAVDESRSALEQAQERAQERAHDAMQDAVERQQVTFHRCQVPEEWPTGPDGPLHPDLVVLSETGYFLSPGRMRALALRIRESEAPVVLACHWRHPVVGWPLDARSVHAILDGTLRADAGGVPAMQVALRVEDPDFELLVWSRGSRGGDAR